MPEAKWGIGRQTTAGLVAGFLLTGAAGLLVATSFRNFAVRGAAVARTHEILALSSRLEASLRGAVSSQRSYVLTGAELDLAAYHAALTRIPKELYSLTEAARAPSAAAVAGRLPRLASLLLAELESAIALRRTLGPQPAAERVARGLGRAAMDSVTAVLQELDTVENGLLADRLAALERSGRRTTLAMAGTALLAVLAFGAALLAVNRSVRQRLAAEARARESDRRAAETSLEQSEERYRKVVELNPDGIFINQDGRIAYANPACLRLLGAASPDEVIGRSPLDFIDPTYHPAVQERIRFLQQTGGVAPFIEERFRRVDGSPVDLEIGAVSIPYGDRRAIQVVMRDVTERRRLEEQLRQASRMEAVGQLAGGIAHDFNNLLTVINGYGEALLRTLPEDHPAAAGLREIVHAGQRAAQLTRQLLAFGRRQVLEPRLVDTNAVVAETGRMLKRLIGEHITLSLVLAQDSRPIRIDPAQVQQVILNLAVNARDAMPRGGSLTIETSNAGLDRAYAATHPGVEPGQYVMIAVSDTGTGMDPHTRAHAFDPFFTTKEPGHGTGLGLATVHGIVQQSGGHIWLYSELEQGTTIKVYFRAAEGTGETLPFSAAELPPGRGTETVLLVEDERAVRIVTRLTLESFGYRVLEAGSGAEALTQARSASHPIHLLITDVVMPGMSGREVVEAMHRISPETRVLYLSGYTDDAVVRHGVLTAEASFLQKPFSAVALAAKVRQVLDG